jgi:hypothetical protein
VAISAAIFWASVLLAPPPEWSDLRAGLRAYCVTADRHSLACTHLVRASRKFRAPTSIEWHEADPKSPLPWAQFTDPDPDWVEYDWFVDYKMEVRANRPTRLRVMRVEFMFTP